MSKLKVYVPQDGPYGLVPEEGGSPVEEETCYLKSEADNLIAELNIRICDSNEDFEIANNQIERLLKIVRHHKYKRCIAMARWCFTKSNYHFVVGRSEGGKNELAHYRISRLYSKWYKRWMELSEKFKEASSGNSERAD